MILQRAAIRPRAVAGDWVILAQAPSAEALKIATPYLAELPGGTQGRTEVVGPGLGLLADAPGMEQIWGEKLAPAGVQVIDVHGRGFSTAVVEWQVPTVQGNVAPAFVIPAAPVLLAIAAVIIAVGWLISKVTVLIRGDAPGGGGGGFFGGLSNTITLLVVGGIAYMVLKSEGKQGD